MKRIVSPLLMMLLLFVNPSFAQKENKMKQLDIQKTVAIKADLEIVYEHIAYLKHFPKWSPCLLYTSPSPRDA